MKHKNILQKSYSRISLLVAALWLTACNPIGEKAIHDFAQETSDHLGCDDFKTKMFEGLYRFQVENEQFPSETRVHGLLLSVLKERVSAKKITQDQAENLADKFMNLYRTLTAEAPELLQAKSSVEILRVLTGIEMGAVATTKHEAVQSKLFAAVKDVQMAGAVLANECPTEPEQPVDTNWTDDEPFLQLLKQSLPLPQYGAHKAFSIYYQSCDAIKKQPVTSSTPTIQGISIVGRTSDGRGNIREITDAALVAKTHYYINDRSAMPETCHNTKAQPLIYDFGGKAYMTEKTTSTFNFFKDAGTGSKVLGVDCSGFVTSALAAAGMKINPTQTKPLQYLAAWSGALKNPQTNGLKCLDRIAVNDINPLKEGDVISFDGHTLMVDDVGHDPFGVDSFKTIADCTLAKMKAAKFNFLIMQSSPSKGGMGMNRMPASYYFSDTSASGTGLREYAVWACKAKFGQKSAKPVSQNLSLVRHSYTEECMWPKAVPFEKQSCLASCK